MQAAARDHHMVNWRWQVLEESLQRDRVVGVEGGSAPGAELGPRLLQALGITGRENNVSALGSRAPGGLQADPGASADHDDGLPEQFWLAGGGLRGGRGGHHSSIGIARFRLWLEESIRLTRGAPGRARAAPWSLP